MSLNSFFGLHWKLQNDEAQRVHQLVKYHIKPEHYLFKKKVDISITTYFKKRPLDSDNTSAKLYVDGLKGRVIENDSPKYVGFVSTKSMVDKSDPRMKIQIIESDD